MSKDLIKKISEKEITLEDALDRTSKEIERSNLGDFLILVIEKIIKNPVVKKCCVSEAEYIAIGILEEDAPISNLTTMLNFLLNHSAEEEEKSYKALQAQNLIIEITHKNKFFNGKNFEEFASLIKDVGPDFIVPFHQYRNGFLHRISQIGTSTKFLEILKEAGADFTITNSEGNSALLAAIANAENSFAVQFLDFSAQHNLEIGIDLVDSMYANNTALNLAVAKGYANEDSSKRRLKTSNFQLVTKLIEHNSNPNIRNKFDFSALDLAVMRRDPDFIRAICSSKLLEEETITSAKELLELDYSTAKENLRRTAGVYLPPNERNFNETSQRDLMEILNHAPTTPSINFMPTSANPVKSPKPICCLIS